MRNVVFLFLLFQNKQDDHGNRTLLNGMDEKLENQPPKSIKEVPKSPKINHNLNFLRQNNILLYHLLKINYQLKYVRKNYQSSSQFISD